MSATENRPYGGNWKESKLRTTDTASDTVVRINGGYTVVACAACGVRIDLNRYLIEASVDASVETLGLSASFTLSVPAHLVPDPQTQLVGIGAEIEIFMRGYFPAEGLFPDLDPPELPPRVAEPSRIEIESGQVTTTDKTGAFRSRARNQSITQIVVHESDTETSAQTETVLARRGLSSHYTVDQDGTVDRLVDEGRVAYHAGKNNANSIGIEVSNPDYGRNARPGQRVIQAPWMDGGVYAVPSQTQTEQTWQLTQDAANRNQVPIRFPAERGDSFSMDAIPSSESNQAGIVSHAHLTGNKVDGSFEVLYGAIRSRGYGPEDAYARSIELAQQGRKVTLPPRVGPAEPSPIGIEPQEDEGQGDTYHNPYYPVFRGIVVDVGTGRSEGALTISVQCSSLLHLWEYQVISSNASLFGVRPSGSNLKTTDLGHNLVGRHPYQILYELHYDSVGAAGGIGWVLSQKTNRDAKTDGGVQYSFIRDYWQERFASREIKLRFHAASGQLLSSLQGAFLARTPTEDLLRIQREKNPSLLLRGSRGTGILDQARTLNLFWPDSDVLQASSKGSPLNLNLAESQAFVSNLGEWGQFQYFESAYETKIDIVNKICEVTGFEFFQDVDGDFVFKPKLYNLDTSSVRVYRIEPHELLTWNASEKEPPVTYCRVRGSRFENLTGTGTEGEWGVDGQYIDYRLVAQFGWRPLEVESASTTTPLAAFYQAAGKVDEAVALSSTASATIPLRAEIRPGYPFFVASKNAYYYCTGFQHNWSAGSNTQTTLQLGAKRVPFRPPGQVGPDQKGIRAITLNEPANPARPLVSRDPMGIRHEIGLPHAVLALDPTRIDPVYLRAGGGLTNLDDPEQLRAVLETAADQRVIKRIGDGAYEATLPDPQGRAEPVRIQIGKGPGIDALQAARQIQKAQSSQQAARDSLRDQIRKARDAGSDPKGGRAALAARNQAAKLEQVLRNLDSTGATTQEESAQVGILLRVLEKLGGSGTPTGPYDEQVRRKADLLRILSDRKAAFLSDQVPGRYRYYSVGMPDPDDQAPPGIQLVRRDGSTTLVETTSEPLDPTYQAGEVEGVRTGTEQDLIEIKQIRPQRGLRVLSGSKPDGEVVPTSQIYEVRMQPVRHQYELPLRERASWIDQTGILKALEAYAVRIFQEAARQGTIGPSTTLLGLLGPAWAQVALVGPIGKAVAGNAVATTLPEISPIQFPTEVEILGTPTGTASPLGEAGTPTAVELACIELAYLARLQFAQKATEWGQLILTQSGGAVQGRAVDSFWGGVAGRIRFPIPTREALTLGKSKRTGAPLQAPVFPVSDRLGYRVVGAFRYGRGIEVGSGGAWNDLRRVDPLRVLDRDQIERVLKEVVVDRKPSEDLARRVATTLQGNLTDSDLLKLGIARTQPDSDLLAFDLTNWIADGREGIHKLPAGNTPMALRDLKLDPLLPVHSGCVCLVSPPGDAVEDGLLGSPDKVMRTLQNQVEDTVPGWRHQQDAVRGAGPGVGPAGSADTVRQVEQAAQRLEQTLSGLVR